MLFKCVLLAKQLALLLLFTTCINAHAANESIEFVAEHLPETAMDNRYGALPYWTVGGADSRNWGFSIQLGYSATDAGALSMSGPTLSLGAARKLGNSLDVTVLAFSDNFRLRSTPENRPLEVLFSQSLPLRLPVNAQFSGLAGDATDQGAGIGLSGAHELPMLGKHRWTVGVLWQRLALRDYALRYRVLDGPNTGTSGIIDYSADYTFYSLYAGIAWRREYQRWISSPHLQIAMPWPRRGMVGAISGQGFAFSGDSKTAGNGAHVGDPSLTAGWDLTYRPWNITLDVGSVVSQMTLERLVHKGVSRNWAVSIRWDY